MTHRFKRRFTPAEKRGMGSLLVSIFGAVVLARAGPETIDASLLCLAEALSKQAPGVMDQGDIKELFRGLSDLSTWKIVQADQVTPGATVIVVRGHSRLIVGRAEYVELLPGYRVLSVLDQADETHFLDSALTHSKIFEDSSGKGVAQVWQELEWSKHPFARRGPLITDVDRARIRKHACAAASARDRKHWQEFARNRDRRNDDVQALRGMGGAGLGCAASFTWGVTARAPFERARDERDSGKRHDWWAEHGSNLVVGVHYMSAAQFCILQWFPFSWNPMARNAIFAGVMTANLAGQVWEEIRLPGLSSQESTRFARSHGKEVRTDWHDFLSGMVGIAGYAVAIESFRRSVDWLQYSVCFK